jgi:hypothetical protein
MMIASEYLDQKNNRLSPINSNEEVIFANNFLQSDSRR